jgi:rhamnogalacturonyl hydrolase YesR
MGHSSFTFYKNESLYELYYLTGERWFREVGLMSSDFAMARWGQGALRNLAHGIWGVLSAYHDTHDEKYLARARFFVDEWGKPWQDKYAGGFQDQHWMYGLLFEAYSKYYEVTDDEETARYLVRALDALIKEFWTEEKGAGFLPGIGVYGFGLGYDYTGDEEYLRKGLLMMELLAKPGVEGDRVKTFAQNFRSSPYFLNYLVKGRKPRVVLGDK